MDIDALTTLALAVQSRPNVYAILLGSGISRAAEIPTGWELTLGLVERIQRLEDPGSVLDPEAWFQEKFGSAPEYGAVVEKTASTRDERMVALRPFFEPTDEEFEQGKKTPTKAHKAIARLVRHGFIRVIVTTNFDRLMEQALIAEGISAKIVDSEDAVKGMTPIQHAGVLVIKLHGDYLDTRIRNTSNELAKYDPEMLGLLERVLVEYGLVVCGWSAEWDDALADAMVRCGHFKFSTHWMARGSPADRARDLIAKRQAEIVAIESADDAFQQLEDRISALSDMRSQHPLSPAIASELTKRYLADPQHRINLHDLVEAEVRRLASATSRDEMRWDAQWDTDEFMKRAGQIETLAANLTVISATMAYHGEGQYDDSLERVIEKLCREQSRSGLRNSGWERLGYYGATLVLYGIGMGCVANSNFSLLKKVILDVGERLRARDESDVLHRVGSELALERNAAQSFHPAEEGKDQANLIVPGSEHVAKHMRDLLKPVFIDESRIDDLFDEFEYAYALISAKHCGSWINLGRFWYRNRQHDGEDLLKKTLAAADRLGGAHPLLAAGFMDGKPGELKAAADAVQRWGERAGYH